MAPAYPAASARDRVKHRAAGLCSPQIDEEDTTMGFPTTLQEFQAIFPDE